MNFYFGKKYLFSPYPNKPSHVKETAGAAHPVLFKGWIQPRSKFWVHEVSEKTPTDSAKVRKDNIR